MSEVQQRPTPPTRGRGSSRGGRGGSSFARGGASIRGTRNSNGDINSYSTEDQSELGQLKKQYSSQLVALKEMFPDWSSEDLLTVIQENNSDLEVTAAKISDGLTAPWGEVKKKKQDRSRSKVKEPSSTGANNDLSGSRGARTARGGSDSRPGGRGRGGAVGGYEPRNSRAPRGRGGAPSNGVARTSKDFTAETIATTTGDAEAESESKPTDASSWEDVSKNESESNGAGGDSSTDAWGEIPKATTGKPTPKATIATGTAWASLFKSPPPAAPVQKKPSPPKQAPPQPTPQPTPQPQVAPEPKEPEPAVEIIPVQKEATPEPTIEPAAPQPEEPVITPAAEPEPEPEAKPEVLAVPEVKETIPTPPQQPLTEHNLEKIEDTAPPAPTTTRASTIASSVPTPSASSSIAPPPPQPTATTPRPAHAGVAMPKGTPRMARRVLDQQEGVVMPSNHGAVEHTTLQFGSMGLYSEDDEDEVEQAETVSQPPQPSPIAQPVTALPPTGPAQLPVSQPPAAEPLPTTRQAPGLPAHPQVTPQQQSQQPPLAPQSMTQQQHINPYNRYGIPDSQQQPQAKAYETFGAPVQQQQSVPQPQTQPQQPQSQPQPPQSQQQAYPGYAPAQLPHQQPSHIGVGVSTTPDQQQQQYNTYYDRTQPPGFGNLYNSSYMQQGQSQQDAGANQQRASSGLGGAAEALGHIPTSAPGPGQVQQPTSRYGAAQVGEQSSNHGTPSPAISTIQQTSQPHNPAIQQYPGGIPGYGYQQHPQYYATQFMHQNYYNHPSPFGKHQGMYAYPQAYMSPQYSDHSSTAAGLGGFGTPTTQGRESVGLGDYGRMNATASQQQQSLPQHSSAGAYGSTIPNFLNSRGLPEQQQLGSGVAQQQAAQQAQNDESMKFGENKPPTGPSSTPSIPGQPGRPGSATSGANMGPQHGAQTPASMYSHLNHNLHGQQAQHSQYGVGQGQSATSQYSMYNGSYPQYGQSSGRHTGTGWGGYGQH